MPSPDLISASSLDCVRGSRAMTARTRHGCSRPAWLAARTASCWPDSSVMMIRFSTIPVAGPPIWSRVRMSAARMSAVVVSVRSVSTVLAPYRLAPWGLASAVLALRG